MLQKYIGGLFFMGKRVKSRSLFLVLIALLMVMTACSGNTTSGNATEKNTDSGSSGDKIELTFWNIWTDPSPHKTKQLLHKWKSL